MSLESTLTRGRAFAEARMTSTCTTGNKSGTDATHGLKKPTWSKTTGVSVRIGGANAGSSGFTTVDIDGAPVSVPVRVASFPIGTAIKDGTVIEMTSGDNNGRFFRVVESGGKDQSTALRVQVVGIERPEGWS